MINDHTILIVDDNEQDLQIIRHLLNELEISFDEVVDGKEALDRLKTHTYKLVLLDAMIKEIDAFKICSYIKNELKTFLPTIAICSLLNDIHINDQLYDCGFDDIFRKPFDESIFKLRIKSYLKLKTYHDSLNEQKSDLEKELENYKNFSLEILRAIYLGVLLFNRKGRVVFENESAINLIGPCLKENINDLFLSNRFMTGKSASYDFLDDAYNEALYLTTSDGKYIEVKRMNLRKGSILEFGAVLIKELNPNSRVMKADHKTLKSFLKSF